MRSAFPPIFPLYCCPWHTCSLATCDPDSIRSFVTCAQFHASFMLEIGASGPGLRLRSEGVQKMPEEMENSKRSHLHGTGYNCPWTRRGISDPLSSFGWTPSKIRTGIFSFLLPPQFRRRQLHVFVLILVFFCVLIATVSALNLTMVSFSCFFLIFPFRQSTHQCSICCGVLRQRT